MHLDTNWERLLLTMAVRLDDEQLFTELPAEPAYQRYRARGKDRRGGRLGPNTIPSPMSRRRCRRGINVTDLDSRMVKGQYQFIQGYNAQAAANEHQIVLAAEIEVASPDFGNLERTLTGADLAAAAASAAPDQNRAAAAIEAELAEIERFLDLRPGAPEHHDQRVRSGTVVGGVAAAHHGDDLRARRSAGKWRPLFEKRISTYLRYGCSR